jgi:uncharacterized protein involved in exopolysaccharide biosynthesis
MNFSKLESIMNSMGHNSLASIARALNTTPQAVSNWKGRDQVPHHIVARINQKSTDNQSESFSSRSNLNFDENEGVSFSDIMLIVAEQLKIIVLVPILTLFLGVTYTKFIKQPLYSSNVTILLPDNQSNNMSGLAGLASQFGVNVPSVSQADLSNIGLLPQLIKSRTFAEKLFNKEFYSKKYNKKINLLSLITNEININELNKEKFIISGLSELNGMLKFSEDRNSSIKTISVTTSEPIFAKELADVVLDELEKLNLLYKSQNANKKAEFIENRISSVLEGLNQSEIKLKAFNERNRQLSSPSLMLEQERIQREVDVQKQVYLTLKQQSELAKIELVQESSIIQVLDKAQIPLEAFNINVTKVAISSIIIGLIIGLVLGLLRNYLNKVEINDRKKIRKSKNFVRKKSIDFLMDKRVSGVLSIMLLVGMPFYLSHQSKSPTYFGMYSAKMLIINIVYILIFIVSTVAFIYSFKKTLDD